MSSNTQHSSLVSLYRLLAASTLVALIGLLAYFILPERKGRILPDLADKYHLFFDGEKNGKTLATWVDEEKLQFKCIAVEDAIEQPYCGLSINLAKAPADKVYSSYKRMELKIQYQGSNERLRISMHNFNPAHPLASYRESRKGLDLTFKTEETQGPIVIHNYGWIVSENPDILNNIIDIGIDLVAPISPGEHLLQLEYIDVYGDLLPAESWYLCVALLWLTTNLLFIARHLILQERRIRNDSKRLSALTNFSDDLQQESQHYKLLSNTDPLTGALNRNGFALEIKQLAPDGNILSGATIMLIDLDHFKQINDSYGHDAGDAVLREAAQVIHKSTRATDLFVRWGGEEFILFCSNINVQQGLLIAEKIRATIESMKIRYNQNTIPVTVSIGLGTTSDKESFDALFQRTDQALYSAKRMGRNCIVLSDQPETESPGQ